MVKGRYKNGEENLRHSPKQVKQVKHFDYQVSCEDVQNTCSITWQFSACFLEWQNWGGSIVTRHVEIIVNFQQNLMPKRPKHQVRESYDLLPLKQREEELPGCIFKKDMNSSWYQYGVYERTQHVMCFREIVILYRFEMFDTIHKYIYIYTYYVIDNTTATQFLT